MIKYGWLLTIYIILSFIFFLITAFTIAAWIIYAFLLPFYGVILLVWWVIVWRNRTRTARIKRWMWGIVLALQVLTILESSANCYGFKQGARCYSNLQTLVGHVPREGVSQVPHWQGVEDAFPGLLAMYGVSLLVGLSNITIE